MSNIIEIQRSIFESLQKNIPIKYDSKFEKLVNFSDYQKQPLNRWFKYREGYSVELVNSFLNEDKIKTMVLDPFCGSGSSLVAAMINGIDAIGIDINPLSVLISRVKTRNYTETEINILHTLTQEIVNLEPIDDNYKIPDLKIIKKAFHHQVLRLLLSMRERIKIVNDERLREFLLLGWISIIEVVSNTYKEGNGIKYRSTKRTKNGYISILDEEWQKDYFGEDILAFVKNQLQNKYCEMLEDIKNIIGKKLGKVKVIEGDARYLTNFVDNNSISTTIFSPPYANCFDYFEIFKLELWMAEFVNCYEDLKKMRRSSLRSNANAELNNGFTIKLCELDKLIDIMDKDKLWDNKIPRILNGYFSDMAKVMSEIYKALKPGGQCIIIVANSSYAGVIIPTDILLAKIGKQIGFEPNRMIVARYTTTSSQQKKDIEPLKEFLRESIIVLKKPKMESGILIEPEITSVPESVEEIPLVGDLKYKQHFLIRSNNVGYITHGIHKYPAKFIPHVPRWAINSYIDKNRIQNILDPFCGSGTTLVEGLLAGQNVYGIDIDPLARLISKVKLTSIPEEVLISETDKVIKEITEKKHGHFLPEVDNLEHWFKKETIKDLSIIRDTIDIRKEHRDIYDFLIICFSSILREVSNADNESQKTYVSHTNPKNPPPAIPTFIERIRDYRNRLLDYMKILPNRGNYYIFPKGDARTVADDWRTISNEKVDLAITSPPYIKAIDYMYNQMVEYFWVGDLFGIKNKKAQNEYKRYYIGTKQINAKEYSSLHLMGFDLVDNLSKQIYEKDKKHSYIVYKFFNDMKKHLIQMRNILAPGAHYIIVIGRCKVSEIDIPTPEIIAEIAQCLSYELKNFFSYKIRNRYMRFPRKGRGGFIENDWVIDLRRN